MNEGQTWLNELRKAGLARFEAVGFPTTEQEEWRFTNVAPISKIPFEISEGKVSKAATEAATAYGFGLDAAAELVFVNGVYSNVLSNFPGKLPRGVKITGLGQSLAREGARIERYLGHFANMQASPFVALNTAHIRDGAYIHLSRRSELELPIHLLFLSTGADKPTVSHPRVLIVAEDGVEATIVRSFVGACAQECEYLDNVVTEMVIGDNCRIDHCKLQHESPHGYHISNTNVHLGRDSRFVSHVATLGGKMTRNDLNVTLAGEGAEATVNGVALLSGNNHCDNHTVLDHAAPNCPSHELYKYVLGGRSTGVFKGKILVRQAAQKTDSKQTSRSLLLSDDATMHSQPALEIYADDVKCTHGSTTGPVDEEQVFYLRSRGISLEAARHLLTYAFAADVTRRIKVEPVRRRLEDYMAAQAGLPKDLRITDLGAHDEAHR